MLIKNVHINNSDKLQTVRIAGGKFSAIADVLVPKKGEQVIDGQNNVLLPPFIDSHIHLDATLTAGEPEWNQTGTLFDGIRIWSERKKQLSINDVKTRARKTIYQQLKYGIQFVRSHVDTTDPHLIALQALLELKKELENVVELQLVAFPQEGILSFPKGKELLEQALKEGADVVGGIPHYEFNHFYGADSLKYVVTLAEKYNTLIDVHCDEIDDPATRNLEVLATLAYETGLKDRVTASHTTAMGAYNDAYTYKLFRLLKMSHINFVSNPLVNMHLGGRFDTYPKRRGLTRVKELTEAGINVSFGEDDIKDPWNPLGNGNMLDPLQMGVYAAQLMGYNQLQNSFNYVTYNAAQTLHVSDHYGIEVGLPANCILLNGKDFYSVLNKHAEVLYNIRAGKVIAKTVPAASELFVD
ncbi:cytosine deaminase [Liquorilactobacillus sucicola DSM 21376 = JCM 15457]|uniref:Cytosine deaminase n=1 Tax=Liquorilactobacillus sucicola DSM 21376 = JCM 15457 TaxID=1423806 RepID=A0A023CV34_9LACO|nr:cytosine deaminase [Liquorilactobacillus sucicola]KRN05657.1 cytosine deaminase [Liquorilactobacillus sucicola DSM 21376 = JCM 15457]GAJ25743.1 cytosine deaminase [Liquorilactobacillus sucicola DSM 21376 = JCM 15457]